MADTAVIGAGEEFAPTLQNILDQKSLRWIFVGGKGGVGKTTTSCSLAVQMAQVRSKVLLISTDPAHNLSDAFGQQFGKDAQKVENVDNLWAMEIDPSATLEEMFEQSNQLAAGAGSGGSGGAANPLGMGGLLEDITASIPGVDEAMSFAEVMKQVKSTNFDVIIFDTAPTGHTLRFLSFPTVLEKALGKVSELTGRLGPLLNGMLGQAGGGNADASAMLSKLETMRQTISEVNTQFKNPDLTTFVAVCIPEFLSLYEMERMIQELAGFHIDIHCIVVNQMLFPGSTSTCAQCNARYKMQQKYYEQIMDLYEDFHVVRMPLLTEEVRGAARIKEFSQMLIEPYNPPN
ncbi:anion-transporting ATPase-like domain-containing protein [Lipomyces oligophaga]|uniref:anion-transporting ATPase-like domain-containing protein n=1 Tax=Lipomyces oligophaga TaxID=45792 RepID=UPI0034CEDA06